MDAKKNTANKISIITRNDILKKMALSRIGIINNVHMKKLFIFRICPLSAKFLQFIKPFEYLLKR